MQVLEFVKKKLDAFTLASNGWEYSKNDKFSSEEQRVKSRLTQGFEILK